MDGKVVRLMKDKGFGFIKGGVDGVDYFFHRSAVRGAVFETLEIGDKVAFDGSATGEKGPRADQVRVEARV